MKIHTLSYYGHDEKVRVDLGFFIFNRCYILKKDIAVLVGIHPTQVFNIKKDDETIV